MPIPAATLGADTPTRTTGEITLHHQTFIGRDILLNVPLFWCVIECPLFMNIKGRWQLFFGEQVPIAYLLRPQNADRWFRIHSLPESKRYPENEAEMRDVLRRHDLIASEVLGENAECGLFFPEHSLRKLLPILSCVASATLFHHYENAEDGADITQMATQVVWQARQFDPLLRLVANDEIRYVSWINLESGEVFAPYDGGADLFLSSTQRRDDLRAHYVDWLSRHPEGV